MARYIRRRLFQLIFVLLGVSFVVFMLLHIAPGDPVVLILGNNYDEETAAILTRELRLDRPVLVQYALWLGDAVRGNLGESAYMKEEVAPLVLGRLPTTGLLAVLAIVLSALMAVPVGVLSAIYRNSWLDNVARVVSMAGVSLPIFWLGLMMIILFSLKLQWLPAGGGLASEGWKALVLPTVALSFELMALSTRMTRAAMLEVLRQDFIRTARAKGLRDGAVYFRHSLRNALLPVVTVMGLQFGNLLGGAVLTETIFSLPGLGRLLVQSINWRDYMLIQGCVLVIAATYALVNLAVDLVYAALDPRIQYS